jgi:hypothetical protein
MPAGYSSMHTTQYVSCLYKQESNKQHCQCAHQLQVDMLQVSRDAGSVTTRGALHVRLTSDSEWRPND